MIPSVTDEEHDESRPETAFPHRDAEDVPPAPREAAARRGPMTVTDYERAMTERAQHARARGLAAPYIPGGEDPDPEATRRQEQPYVRLLILMVAAIIIGGFALSIIGLVVLGNAAPP